jgi:hypothetical protein
MLTSSTTKSLSKDKSQAEMPNLQNLPYDLLLNIAQYVDLRDVHALQLVSAHFSTVVRSWEDWTRIPWVQTRFRLSALSMSYREISLKINR